MVAGAVGAGNQGVVDSGQWEGFDSPWLFRSGMEVQAYPELNQNPDWIVLRDLVKQCGTAMRTTFQTGDVNVGLKRMEEFVRASCELGAMSAKAFKTTQGGGGAGGFKKRMVESKMLQGLDLLSDSKSTPFKQWCDRLINCMAVNYDGVRPIMQNVMSQLDQTRATPTVRPPCGLGM